MVQKVFYNTAKLGQATENPVIMPVSSPLHFHENRQQ
jgi:hypothetical protein